MTVARLRPRRPVARGNNTGNNVLGGQVLIWARTPPKIIGRIFIFLFWVFDTPPEVLGSFEVNWRPFQANITMVLQKATKGNTRC